MEEYQSIKVPLPVYESQNIIKQELVKNGIGRLPEEILQPKACPVCNTKLQFFKSEYEYHKCEHCGYQQQAFTTTSNFTNGVVLGLGLAALIYLIFKNR